MEGDMQVLLGFRNIRRLPIHADAYLLYQHQPISERIKIVDLWIPSRKRSHHDVPLIPYTSLPLIDWIPWPRKTSYTDFLASLPARVQLAQQRQHRLGMIIDNEFLISFALCRSEATTAILLVLATLPLEALLFRNTTYYRTNNRNYVSCLSRFPRLFRRL
jgi:hypothetical protein